MRCSPGCLTRRPPACPPAAAAKLENDTETFEHDRVSSELKKQIQQARLAKKLTQAQARGGGGVVGGGFAGRPEPTPLVVLVFPASLLLALPFHLSTALCTAAVPLRSVQPASDRRRFPLSTPLPPAAGPDDQREAAADQRM